MAASGNGNRTHFVGVRLDDAEFSDMERRRVELSPEPMAELRTSDYIRMLIAADASRGEGEGPQGVGCDMLFWHNVVLQLRRIGTNLNQSVEGLNDALLNMRLHGWEDSEDIGKLLSRLNTLRFAAAGTLEEMSKLAEACADVHERAGVQVTRTVARALMRQAARTRPTPEEAEACAGRWAD